MRPNRLDHSFFHSVETRLILPLRLHCEAQCPQEDEWSSVIYLSTVHDRKGDEMKTCLYVAVKCGKKETVREELAFDTE